MCIGNYPLVVTFVPESHSMANWGQWGQGEQRGRGADEKQQGRGSGAPLRRGASLPPNPAYRRRPQAARPSEKLRIEILMCNILTFKCTLMVSEDTVRVK